MISVSEDIVKLQDVLPNVNDQVRKLLKDINLYKVHKIEDENCTMMVTDMRSENYITLKQMSIRYVYKDIIPYDWLKFFNVSPKTIEKINTFQK